MAEVCERARVALSAAADGDADEVDRGHVATCESCRAFEAGIRSVRASLRFEVVDDAPDVAPTVLERVARARAPRRIEILRIAAAILVGAVIGSAYVGPDSDGRDVAVASLPAQVVAAQRDVASLAADVTVIEGDTSRMGTLRYRAPETLELRLDDTTLAAADGTWTITGSDGTAAAHSVEPFATGSPVPLDLVLPVASFNGADVPPSLPDRVLDGRDAVGVRVTAAQLDALLDGLRPMGDGRTVHPTDPVDLWLDREHLVPLQVVVRAAAGPDRARWAAARGYEDDAGAVVLDVRLTNVVVNDALAVDGLAAPATDVGRDGGFREGDVSGPLPAWLPVGMHPWRAGTHGDVAVQTWTDGRAWIKVRSSATWAGDRLFGDVGLAVRAVRLGDGIAYVGEGGDAVALHAAGLDVVVSGSVSAASLLQVAATLDVVGQRVPASWHEAATVEVDDLPGALVLPEDAGFAAPSARVDGDTVTLVFAGPGERAATLSYRPGDVLAPPLDPDAVGVGTRGERRWSPSRGDLEWVADGRMWSMRSTSVALAELVALADALVAP